MIRVVVTGSECTGKTTLARSLGEHYRVPVVPEYARRFVAAKGGAPAPRDVAAIARGQLALEDSTAAAADLLLIQDTDLLSTVVYGRHYFKQCPRWIEEALGRRGADLYLLADIDVPWVPDGDQRDRGDRREEMHDLFRRALLERNLPFVSVRGSRAERLRLAVAAIDRLLVKGARQG
jgi:NadR type nicotinamide-nucleotide adenylyltransferase